MDDIGDVRNDDEDDRDDDDDDDDLGDVADDEADDDGGTGEDDGDDNGHTSILLLQRVAASAPNILSEMVGQLQNIILSPVCQHTSILLIQSVTASAPNILSDDPTTPNILSDDRLLFIDSGRACFPHQATRGRHDINDN